MEIEADRKDFFGSLDSLDIVSYRLREILESFRDPLDFFSIPSAPDYFVISPKKLIVPQPDDPAFRPSRQCSVCGRFREVVWGYVPFTVMDPFQIAAFQLEGWRGMRISLTVSEPVVVALKAAKPRLAESSMTRWIRF